MVYEIGVVYRGMVISFFGFSLFLFGFEHREFQISCLKFGFLSGA